MKQLRAEAADYRKQAADLARGAVSRQRANFALNAGNQLMLRGQIADAITRYQESVAADSTFAEAQHQLAIALRAPGPDGRCRRGARQGRRCGEGSAVGD